MPHTKPAPKITYTLRHSKKARSWRIKITPAAVEIVVPRRASKHDIESIINKKRDWIEKHWRKIQESIPHQKLIPPARYEHGASVPYRGELFPLLVELKDIKKPHVFFSDVAFHISLPLALPIDEHHLVIKKHIKNWMVEKLRGDIERIFAEYAPRLGHAPKTYRIKHQRTLWGSCSRRGNININFGLIYTPYSALEYVTVHELCHLPHPNHSRAFWNKVESLLPDYKTPRRWLKDNGYVIGVK